MKSEDSNKFLAIVMASLLIVMVSTAFTGCVEEEDDVETLDISMTDEPADWNPVSFTSVREGYIFRQIFDVLIHTHPDGDVNTDGRALADSYEVSEDGLLYTFEIKEGVTFHNGDEVTADDLEFTLNTLREVDETELYDVDDGPSSPREGDFAAIDSVDAVDAYTLEIHMDEVDPELLITGQMGYSFAFPKDFIEENGWDAFEDELIGSGPYEFEEYNPGENVILEEYEDYRGDVGIPRIYFRFYDDVGAAVTALRVGDIDYMVQMDPTNFFDLQGEEGVVTESYPEIRHQAIRFNQRYEGSPFQEEKVRRALAWAIDFEELVQVTQEELADSSRSPLPPDFPAHCDELPEFEQDIGKAEDLLDEAGYPDGVSTELYVPQGWPTDEMSVMQEQVEEAGFDIELNALARETFYDEVEAGNAPVFYVGWLGSASPWSMMNPWISTDPWNYYSGYYNNTEFDEALEKARRTIDEEERNDFYREAQQILVEEDVGALFLYTTRRPQAHREELDVPEEAWVPHMGGPMYTVHQWTFE